MFFFHRIVHQSPEFLTELEYAEENFHRLQEDIGLLNHMYRIYARAPQNGVELLPAIGRILDVTVANCAALTCVLNATSIGTDVDSAVKKVLKKAKKANESMDLSFLANKIDVLKKKE